METPKVRWMMTGGTLPFRTPPAFLLISVQAPEALLEQTGSSMPSTLYITVPRVAHGTPDQVKCTGKYDTWHFFFFP